MTASFRAYQFPADHPRLSSFAGCDAYSYTDALWQLPVIGDALREWENQFESTSFRGITSNGTVIPSLFPAGSDEAPTCRQSPQLKLYWTTCLPLIDSACSTRSTAKSGGPG